MRIDCPGCAAEYDVPEVRLVARKLVRCARCGVEWQPARVGAAAGAAPEPDHGHPAPARTVVAPEPVPGIQAMDRLAASAAALDGPPAGLMAVWVLTVIVMVGAVAAAVTWRDSVMRAWPPSGRILVYFGPSATATAQIVDKKSE